MTEEKKTQVAVIGAGPGGYPAAFLAADLGLDVTVIDPEKNPGGVCLYRGCIPSKRFARSPGHNRGGAASDWGSRSKPVMTRQTRIGKTGWSKLVGGLGQLSKQRKINYVQGRAKFIDSHTLEIKTNRGGTELLKFENAVIATGSRPAVIPGLNASQHSCSLALDLPTFPRRCSCRRRVCGLTGTVYAALTRRYPW
jgi:dihydrolipoamide dehydrogenase